MVFGRFLCVCGRVQSVAGGYFRMMSALFVVARFVMFRRLPVVLRGEFVMLGGLPMVLNAFVSCHFLLPLIKFAPADVAWLDNSVIVNNDFLMNSDPYSAAAGPAGSA